MRRSILKACIAAALIGFYAVPVLADNVADSRTTGNQNLSTIDQAGDDVSSASEAFVIQSGDGNSSEVGQGIATGRRQHGFRSAEVTQTGDDNLSRVEQNGPNNAASVEQVGSGNETDVQQDNAEFDDDNEASSTQLGDDNFSGIAQRDGKPTGRRQHGARTATVLQDGNDNTSRVDQTGPSNIANVEQLGDGNESDILQDSADVVDGGDAGVVQMGEDNLSTIVQDEGIPTGRRQHSRVATVLQDGNDNVSLVEQLGPNNTASVEQLGDRNEAEVFQVGQSATSGNTATVFQSGTGNRARIDQTTGRPTGKR